MKIRRRTHFGPLKPKIITRRATNPENWGKFSFSVFFSTVFEGNLNISTVNGVQVPFRMNYNHFPPFQTISDTFWKNFFFRKILLDMVPPVHPKKIGKKVNFFRIFSKFYHVILAYLGCYSSNFTCHKPF